MVRFGERLRELRTAKSLSTKDVAKKVGIPQSRYSELEKGIRVPTPGQIERLAGLYGVDAGELKQLEI